LARIGATEDRCCCWTWLFNCHHFPHAESRITDTVLIGPLVPPCSRCWHYIVDWT
jgi:hypothetical protein